MLHISCHVILMMSAVDMMYLGKRCWRLRNMPSLMPDKGQMQVGFGFLCSSLFKPCRVLNFSVFSGFQVSCIFNTLKIYLKHILSRAYLCSTGSQNEFLVEVTGNGHVFSCLQTPQIILSCGPVWEASGTLRIFSDQHLH